jgi:hypothetical protein
MVYPVRLFQIKGGAHLRARTRSFQGAFGDWTFYPGQGSVLRVFALSATKASNRVMNNVFITFLKIDKN